MLRETMKASANKITDATTKAIEIPKIEAIRIVDSSELAELGAVKPVSFGSLIRQKYTPHTPPPQQWGLGLQRRGHPLYDRSFAGEPETAPQTDVPALTPEIARECAEYLCDHGLIPEAWQQASPEQKMSMLNTAAGMIAKELSLPYEPAGGVDLNAGIKAIPLDADYYDALADLWAQVLQLKQSDSRHPAFSQTAMDTPQMEFHTTVAPHIGTELWYEKLQFRETLKEVIRDRFP